MRSNLMCLAILLGGACVEPGPELGQQSSDVLSTNRLSANRLSANGLSMNRLSANRLSANRLASNRLSANALASPLYTTAEGRELMTYVVRCALPVDETLEVDVSGRRYEFSGLLGLAPKWADKPLDAQGKGWISACLLAHVNEEGMSVPISLRGTHDQLKKLEPNEAQQFRYQEGAFYGDVFRADPLMYACLGWDDQGAYGSHSPHLAERVCVAGTPAGETSPCGFVNTGACQEVCDAGKKTTKARYSEAWDDCATGDGDHEGDQHGHDDDGSSAQVITVFLGGNQ
jgi:hypothetical protein